MKYFRNEKMEEMTIRRFSLAKIIAFAMGILFALTTPKEHKKILTNVTLIGLLIASLYSLSETVTCTLHIGFSSEEDDDDEDVWDDDDDDDDYFDELDREIHEEL